MSTPTSCLTEELRPTLDPAFRPPIVAYQAARALAEKERAGLATRSPGRPRGFGGHRGSGGRRSRPSTGRAPRSDRHTTEAAIAIERESGLVSRFEMPLPRASGPHRGLGAQLLERAVKLLLWSRGGFRVHLAVEDEYADLIQAAYRDDGDRAFDAGFVARVYERPLEVRRSAREDLPREKNSSASLGGNLDGCRIGFDLGASDYKIAAVKDGEVVYSGEIPWNPREQEDPDWHFERVDEGLRRAARHLPRVDAIGGSSAGVLIDNRLMTASLIRSVREEKQERARSIFSRLQEKWKVPLVVLNDGEVTALAGGLSLNLRGVLGIAMGSSEATGFLDRDGRITGWLNELAFAPVDLSPTAARDEWSRDRGVGARYFSQQAVGRLVPRAGLERLPGEPLPELLERTRLLADEGDERAISIFRTIGTYLGFTLPWYRLFYDFEHVLLLGRVTSGVGGCVIKETAEHLLRRAFAEQSDELRVHLPDEKSRRVGQAVAAASLVAVASS